MREIVRDGAAISVISYGEVWDGVLRSRTRAIDMRGWQKLLTYVDVLDISQDVADLWAALRGDLRSRGERVGDNDLLIASTALRFGLTLVTRNQRRFGRIGGLPLLVPA